MQLLSTSTLLHVLTVALMTVELPRGTVRAQVNPPPAESADASAPSSPPSAVKIAPPNPMGAADAVAPPAGIPTPSAEPPPLPSVPDVIRESCKASPKDCTRQLRRVVARERVDDLVDGQTPLLLAVRLARPLAVTALLDMGADKSVVADDGQGHTPLHAAAAMGNVEIAQLLLEAGDNPNLMAPDGLAPIHRACRGEGLGHTEVVELLLKHGVNVKEPAADGKEPIELVRHNRATRERLQHELRRHGEL